MTDKRQSFTTPTISDLWPWQTLQINHCCLPVQGQARPHDLSQYHGQAVTTSQSKLANKVETICSLRLCSEVTQNSLNRIPGVHNVSEFPQIMLLVPCLGTSAFKNDLFLWKCRFQDPTSKLKDSDCYKKKPGHSHTYTHTHTHTHILIFCGTGIELRVLYLLGRMLYHLSHSPSPCLVSYFFEIGSCSMPRLI
jgi:hypothetical protein